MDRVSAKISAFSASGQPGQAAFAGQQRAQAPDVIARQFAAAQTLLQRAQVQDLDRTLSQALALVGKAMQAGRAYIFLTKDMVFLDNTHEWCADGVRPMRQHLQKVPYSDGDPFWQMFRRTGVMIIPDLEQTAPDSGLRQVLEGQGICALIATALWMDGQIAGFVGFDFVDGPKVFRPDEDTAIRSFAATVALSLTARNLSRELTRVDAERAAADARLSAAISRAPKLLVETDGDGVITGFFQSAPLVFALNPQEVIGAPPEQVLPPHVAALVRKAMFEVDTLGWSQSHTYSLLVGDVRKWFRMTAMARNSTKDRRKSGYMFVVSDISETQRQDTQIRQLVRVAELSTNVILLLDKDRQITWANPAFHARSGYTNEMAIGKLPREVLHLSDDQPERVVDTCKLLKAGQSISREFSAKSRRGVQYWLDLNIQPLRSPEGEVQGFMLVGVDITTHKLAEARAFRDRMRTLDASKEGYAIIWPGGRVAFINAELRRLLHVPDTQKAEDLIWTDIALPDFTERLVTILPEFMAHGFWSGEVTLPTPDGPPRQCEVSLTLQDDGSIFLIVRDITARRQAEADRAHLYVQLQIAQGRQVMSHMAAGLAHDFANLLAVISGSVEVLEPHITPEGRSGLARIRQASQQGRDLVSNLMTFGTETDGRAHIDLQETLIRAIDLIRPSLSVPVVAQLGAQDKICITADATQVMQVAVNLLMNADQAIAAAAKGKVDDPTGADMGARGQITLSLSVSKLPEKLPSVQVGHLSAAQSYVVMTISDTGPGIPKCRRAEIFAPFVSSRHAKGAGANSGLGLAIVAHIVSLHGGALHVTDTATGGAELQVFWPLPSAPQLVPPLAPGQGLVSEYPLRGMTVLLVDDDDHVLQTLSEILSKAGAETVSCDNPLDALAAVIEDPDAWDAVVTDYEMTPMTGLELLQQLRITLPDLKIILLSGASQLHFAKNSVHTDDVAMLRKPISGPELIAVLLREKLRDAGGQTKG